MNLQEYINVNYSGSKTWFESEVSSPEHVSRIRKVNNNINSEYKDKV